MESQRSFLFFGLALVSFLLYQQWQIDYNTPVQVEQQTAQTVTVGDDTSATNSSASEDLPSSEPSMLVPAAPTQKLVKVVTDTLEVLIDTKGGDVVSATLIQHNLTHQSAEKYQLLSQERNYAAQSGLVGRHGPDSNPAGRPVYAVESLNYELTDNALVIPMTTVTKEGLKVTKTFYFERGKHSIEVTFDVENGSSNTLAIQPFYQLKQKIAGEESSMMMPTYRGATYSTDDVNYEKYDFEDMIDEKLNIGTVGGWVSMIEHYFVSAWVPTQDTQNIIYSRITNNQTNAIIGIKSPEQLINAGETLTIKSVLFAGPKLQSELEAIHHHLDLTIDYGFMVDVSQGLFWLLNVIYDVLGNWGLAIIVITIIVKTLLYPLTKKQYTSMAKMRALQPKMEQLKARFGDDRQKMGQAMMELYKKEKVNPMGGCLPLLLQMPIFLALYWVFLESVELRHAPFGLWITDLSAKDPYFILPILFGASMWLMQKLSPTPSADPMQQKMMMWMPVIFSVFFVMFPAGLVLYWLVSNLISIAQMLYIYKQIDKQAAAKKKS